jgi:hypothetical protein
MKLLKHGSEGPEVVKLQKLLKITADGQFGPMTHKAVIRFQMHNELHPDGIVGDITWSMLVHAPRLSNESIDEDTDASSQYFKTNFNQSIHRYHLDADQYLKKPGKNEYFFLHHTAGGANPYTCIDHWNRDSRGRIATEFVLGGQDYKSGNADYDGIMVQAFPEDGYGWHLGKTGSGYMNKHSIGLEICSIGYLDNEDRSYVGSKAIASQIISLDEVFRRKLKWHKYSDDQIEEIHKLILYIQERDQIDMRLGLQQFIKKYGPTNAFEFQEDAYYGKIKGLLSHTNVRKTKMDVYPDPRLIDVIMSIK